MLYTLAIRVKEINKSRLFLFAVLSVRSRSFEELSALRSSVFNFQFSPLASVRLSVPFHFFEIFFRIFYFLPSRDRIQDQEKESDA